MKDPFMVMQLRVIAGPVRSKSVTITPGEAVRIGRSKATQTQLTDPTVSRAHCELQIENDQIIVHDSNSAAGTFVNGKRITRRTMKSADVIQVVGNPNTFRRYNGFGT